MLDGLKQSISSNLKGQQSGLRPLGLGAWLNRRLYCVKKAPGLGSSAQHQTGSVRELGLLWGKGEVKDLMKWDLEG